jgi:predicted lipid-binding transport protein (Tim44 family)
MQSGWIEIFFLAMLAGFIALRLYHVLGRRTGHEKPVSDSFRSGRPTLESPRPGTPAGAEPLALPELPADVQPAARSALESIIRLDRSFDPKRFLASAKDAYGMVMEAFWAGDEAALSDLVADDLLAEFRSAIARRRDLGQRLENRLVSVDDARIVDAVVNGMMAEISVRFQASIIATVRDAEGRVVEGDPSRPVGTRDLWTFSRHLSSPDPAWLLIATEEEA